MKNIKVTYKYLYANPVRETTSIKYLLNDVINRRAAFLQKWLDTDALYDPTNDYKVTKLKLDKDKKITQIELTEMENTVYG